MFKTLIKLFIINLVCVIALLAMAIIPINPFMLFLLLLIAFIFYHIFFGAYSVIKTSSILKALLVYISTFVVILATCILIQFSAIGKCDILYAKAYLEDFFPLFTIITIPFLISVVITKLILIFKAKRNKDANMEESKGDE